MHRKVEKNGIEYICGGRALRIAVVMIAMALLLIGGAGWRG